MDDKKYLDHCGEIIIAGQILGKLEIVVSLLQESIEPRVLAEELAEYVPAKQEVDKYAGILENFWQRERAMDLRKKYALFHSYFR